MYVPIYLVRIDDRTGYIYIQAGEEIQVLIDKKGDLVDE